MALLLIIALLLFGSAIVIVGRVLVSARTRMVQNVGGIAQYGFSAATQVEDVASRNSINELASFVGGAVGSKLRALRESDLRQQLVSAGTLRAVLRPPLRQA